MPFDGRAFRSCFIRAPYGAALGALPAVLDRAGIDWEWAKTDLGLTERLPGDLRNIVRSVDFVLGVFLGGAEDAYTFFRNRHRRRLG